MKVPIVTVVGKPNVGKSTLFNKIAGSRIAITADEPGTTRDRLFHRISHSEMDFFLVDTGGLEFGKGDTTIEDDMQLQARVAIEESDLILFLIDSKEALTTQDYAVAELLRKKGGKKPVFLVANKCDRFLEEAELASLYNLGLGEPLQVSALHRTGVDMMVDKVISNLKENHFLTKSDDIYKKALEWEKDRMNIAVVGKPNVGKSSIVNALLNKNKLIVSEIPGTTRDTTDTVIKHEGKEYNFIDTAGLKKRGKLGRGIERFSALRSMEAIERSDIALLVIDTSQPISHQDKQIAHYVLEAAKGLIILANKWDIKDEDAPEEEEKRRAKYLGYLKRNFSFLPWTPVIFTSAVTKKNLNTIFDQMEVIKKERNKRIKTAELNNFLEKTLIEHKPTGHGRVYPKIYYITQVSTNPPHFVAFINKRKAFHFSYWRYLENRLREKFGFTGTAIRLEHREKEPRK